MFLRVIHVLILFLVSWFQVPPVRLLTTPLSLFTTRDGIEVR